GCDGVNHWRTVGRHAFGNQPARRMPKRSHGPLASVKRNRALNSRAESTSMMPKSNSSGLQPSTHAELFPHQTAAATTAISIANNSKRWLNGFQRWQRNGSVARIIRKRETILP